jgi:hypothetical protein
MTNMAFEDRCASNPQGVIKDLVAQTVRQATTINVLTLETERLKVLLVAAGIDATAPPKPKTAGRKKKVLFDEPE